MKKQKTPIKTMFNREKTEVPKGKTAVVVAHLEEPDLAATLASVRDTFPQGVVVEVEDVFRRGCAWARNEGISKAAAMGCDVVILIDAHMRFSPKALNDVDVYVRDGKMRLVGAPCHHNERCNFDDTPYHNARLTMTAQNGDERVALCGQWRKDGEPLNCVMGACYGFRIADYVAAGRPLRLLSGWGSDEEALSLAFLFAGGEIFETTKPVAHLYRTRVHLPPTPQSRARTWSNRYLVVQSLPLCDKTRADLLAFMDASAYVQQHRSEIMQEVAGRLPIAHEIRHKLESFGVPESVALGDCRPSTLCGNRLAVVSAERTEPKDITPIIIRHEHAETCHRCGSVDSYTQTRGLRRGGAVATAPLRCQVCGSKATLHVVK
jgi:hypothetical protein